MSLALGSLCSGVDGLALGLERSLGARTVWQSEIDPHASTVLAHRWPGVPNLGDLTAVGWTDVEPIDVLCAGFPCQPVSQAGQRQGINDERWLWDDIATALGRMDPRPRLLLLENVTGLLTANDGDAMARIVEGLASLGYVGRHRVLGSRDVGAPHRRERVFVAAHAERVRVDPNRRVRSGDDGGRHPTGPAALPAGPQVARAANPEPDRTSVATDAPTPRRGQVGTRERSDSGRTSGQPGPLREPGRRGGAVADPDSERLTLWPECDGTTEDTAEAHHQLDELDPDGRVCWGIYEPAIRRWEAVHGPAPDPRDHKGRLNPELPEWMMGFTPGWVTGLDIPRTAQLRLLGNSVQPQVAELAAQLLLLPLLALETAA